MIDETGLLAELSPEDKALETEIAAPPPKAEPAKVEESKAEVKEEPKLVPIQALDEARHKARELSDRLTQESEKRAKMEARFEEFTKRLQSPPPKAPEYEQDPLGHLKHTASETQAKLTEFEKWKTDQAAGHEAAVKEQEFVGKYQALAADFMKTNKDFPAAYAYLLDSWAGELSELGFQPQEVAQQKLAWERGIAQKALADGVNPAERIMKAAKVRGYKAIAPNANQQMETLRKGAQAAKSLSAAGGDVEPPTTLEALAELEGEEFDKMFDKIVNGGRSGRII